MDLQLNISLAFWVSNISTLTFTLVSDPGIKKMKSVAVKIKDRGSEDTCDPYDQ